jgi:hypothetical protein
VTTDTREDLRVALAKRGAARDARDQAKSALARAENVLRAVEAETEKHEAASNRASADNAGEIAASIRAGQSPDIAISATLETASHALVDAKNRSAVALAARDQLQKELTDAEGRLKQCEQGADAAALAIIVSEAETLAAEVGPTLKRLIEIGDHLNGVGRLWRPDERKPIELSMSLQHMAGRLREAAPLLDPAREQRAISRQPPENYAAAHIQAYRERLLGNPDTRLADVEVPTLPGAFDHIPNIAIDLLAAKDPRNFGRLGARPKPPSPANGASDGPDAPFAASHGMRRKPDVFEKG